MACLHAGMITWTLECWLLERWMLIAWTLNVDCLNSGTLIASTVEGLIASTVEGLIASTVQSLIVSTVQSLIASIVQSLIVSIVQSFIASTVQSLIAQFNNLFFEQLFNWTLLEVRTKKTNFQSEAEFFYGVSQHQCWKKTTKEKGLLAWFSLETSLKQLVNKSNPTLAFPFPKKKQKNLVWEQIGSCFFSSFTKKKVSKKQIVCFFVEQKHCNVWSKNKTSSHLKLNFF